jgi:hypothetical protein
LSAALHPARLSQTIHEFSQEEMSVIDKTITEQGRMISRNYKLLLLIVVNSSIVVFWGE